MTKNTKLFKAGAFLVALMMMLGSFSGGYNVTIAHAEEGSEVTDPCAEGHTWDEGSETEAPTCTEEGVMTYTCKVCGETKTEAIDATGHSPETVTGYAATCTEEGMTDGIRCSVCEETIEAQQKIPAKGHTLVTDEGTAATCTAEGLTDGTHCSVCGETIEAQQKIPAKGHTAVKDEGYAATCTTEGLTDGSHCSVCGETIEAQQKIPAKGHTAVKDEGYAATCTAEGLTDGSHCSVCGEKIEVQQKIPAKGHTPVTDPKVEPTTSSEGLTEGSHCSVCGEVLVAQQTIPALKPEPESKPEPETKPDVSAQIDGQDAPELDTDDDFDDFDEEDLDEYDDFDDFDEFEDDEDDGTIFLDDWDAGVVSDEMLDRFNNSTANYEQMEFNGTAEIELENEGTLKYGDEIKLNAKVQDVNLSYRLIWEANDSDDRGWYTIASGENYSYTLTADNVAREYRVVLFSLD
jgi:predicted nucleic acid-binding Zn ribbon protein